MYLHYYLLLNQVFEFIDSNIKKIRRNKVLLMYLFKKNQKFTKFIYVIQYYYKLLE